MKYLIYIDDLPYIIQIISADINSEYFLISSSTIINFKNKEEERLSIMSDYLDYSVYIYN